MLALMLGAVPAQAGWYQVTYSGGTATRTGVYGDDPRPYYHDTSSDSYSGGLYTPWGIETGPDDAFALTGTVDCEGTIDATFTWHAGGSYGYTPAEEDPPPKSVVIKETCNTYWYGYYSPNAIPTGSDSNGLGGTTEHFETPPGSDPMGQSNSSSGTLYWIKEDPGPSFKISRSPYAHVSGTGAVGQPIGTGWGAAGVTYKATAEPLKVILTGGIAGSLGSRKYLIGQRVGATLISGGLTPTLYFWGISGGEPFKSYSADSHEAFLTPIDFFTSTGSSFGFHFKEPVPLATVTCSVHLAVPTGAMPAAGLDVSPFARCVVGQPVYTVRAGIGTTQAYGPPPPAAPTDITITGAELNSGSSLNTGVVWEGEVTTPAEFGTDGGWNFTQTEVTNHSVVSTDGTQTQTHTRTMNGLLALDNDFGYAPEPEGSLYSANGAPNSASDSPNQHFSSSFTEIVIADSFTTYVLYKPPGGDSCYVPLKNLQWSWSGYASPNQQGVWSVTQPGSSLSIGEDFPDHPLWSRNIEDSRWTPAHPLLQP